MQAADDVCGFGHGLFGWSVYDAASKVDVHAHALLSAGRLLLFDPVPLSEAAWSEMAVVARGVSVHILITNGNHARAAADFRQRLGGLVLASAEAVEELRLDRLDVDEIIPETGGALLNGAVEAVPLPGFAGGETAFFSPSEGGLIVMGDALINLPGFPFAPLPAKYCRQREITLSSLERLLAFSFRRMAFAHGPPLLSNAREDLAGLLHRATPG